MNSEEDGPVFAWLRNALLGWFVPLSVSGLAFFRQALSHQGIDPDALPLDVLRSRVEFWLKSAELETRARRRKVDRRTSLIDGLNYDAEVLGGFLRSDPSSRLDPHMQELLTRHAINPADRYLLNAAGGKQAYSG